MEIVFSYKNDHTKAEGVNVVLGDPQCHPGPGWVTLKVTQGRPG